MKPVVVVRFVVDRSEKNWENFLTHVNYPLCNATLFCFLYLRFNHFTLSQNIVQGEDVDKITNTHH